MGRINKWITLTLIFFNIGFLLLANEPIIPNQIPRTEKGLENIYVQRLFEGQKDDSALEDSEYWVETTRKIHFFLDKQEKLPPNKLSRYSPSFNMKSKSNEGSVVFVIVGSKLLRLCCWKKKPAMPVFSIKVLFGIDRDVHSP